MIASLNDLQLELWLRKRNSGEIIWVTKNGDKLQLKNLSDQHLVNIINYLTEKQEYEDIVLENSDIL